MKKVYVLVKSKNDQFYGVFGTEEQAQLQAKYIEGPTQVFEWHVHFPQDFTKLDEHIAATLKFAGLSR